MPLKFLAQMGKEPLPMLVRQDDAVNKVLALKAAGLVHALESEDQDEMLVCLTDKGRRALESDRESHPTERHLTPNFPSQEPGSNPHD